MVERLIIILVCILINMYNEILTQSQKDLLGLVESFSEEFGLVGGTAIALQIGHRESIDFDMFTPNNFDNFKIKRKLSKDYKNKKIVRDEKNQLTFFLNDVQFTFFCYPFNIKYTEDFDGIVKMPNLLTLAAMKAYALGRRAKWKDYVDLYFIMRDHHNLDEIVRKTKDIFEGEFNDKMFKVQLTYFEDLNYSEDIIYKEGFEVSNKEIQKKLIEYSLN